jgi:RNA polymerase sigma factor (sigma-70 family)
LTVILASRAERLGSKDGENAAHEALTRSLEHALPREALEYFFLDPPTRALEPAWSLSQLMAWLFGVLRNVVLEEQNGRASRRREVLTSAGVLPDVRDRAADPLDALIDDDLRAVVRDCLSTLSREYREVLALRHWKGLKYSEIAARLSLNANTVATRLARGTEMLARLVLDRVNGPRRTSATGESRVREVPHA